MKKNNPSRCIILFLLAIGLVIFSLKGPVHSKSELKDYSFIALDTKSDRIFAAQEDGKGIDVIDIKTGAVTNSILTNKEIEAMTTTAI